MSAGERERSIARHVSGWEEEGGCRGNKWGESQPHFWKLSILGRRLRNSHADEEMSPVSIGRVSSRKILKKLLWPKQIILRLTSVLVFSNKLLSNRTCNSCNFFGLWQVAFSSSYLNTFSFSPNLTISGEKQQWLIKGLLILTFSHPFSSLWPSKRGRECTFSQFLFFFSWKPHAYPKELLVLGLTKMCGR